MTEIVDEKLARRTVADVRRLMRWDSSMQTDIQYLLEAIAVSVGRASVDVENEWQLLEDWQKGDYRTCCFSRFKADTGADTDAIGEEYPEWLISVLETVLADPRACDPRSATAALLAVLSGYVYAGHYVQRAANIAERKKHPIQSGGLRSMFDREVGKAIKVALIPEMRYPVEAMLRRARSAQFPLVYRVVISN